MGTGRRIKRTAKYCNLTYSVESIGECKTSFEQTKASGNSSDYSTVRGSDKQGLCGDAGVTDKKTVIAPASYSAEEEWVQDYMAQFKTEPSFF